MPLGDALNKRMTGQQHVVPVPVKSEGLMILDVEPQVEKTPDPEPVTGQSALSFETRDLRPGEVGTKTEPAYPDVPYSAEALATLLTRLGKGSAFLLDNLGNEKGHAQLGYFIDLMDATGAMMTAHMAHGILNKD